MTYTLEEQETHIYFDASNRQWYIETNYAPHIVRLTKLGLHKDKLAKLEYDEKTNKITNIRVPIDEEDFLIKPFPKKRRKLTDEEKKVLNERLKKGKQHNEED